MKPPPLEGPSQEEKWRALVAALRSGEYAQTHSVLHRLGSKGGYCCLGVACEVAMINGLPMRKEISAGCIRYSTLSDSMGSSTNLPDGVMAWYGVHSDNPWLKVPREVKEKAPVHFAGHWDKRRESQGVEVPLYAAAMLNDSHEFPLELIADCFEATFLPEDWEARCAQG